MMNISIEKFEFNPFSENTFVVADEKGNCVIIDPGCFSKEEKETLYRFIKDNSLTPHYILNTHCHLDHIMGNRWLRQKLDVPLLIPEGEKWNLENSALAASMFGVNGFENSPEPDQWLKGGEQIKFGNIEFEVLFTPGHSAGHVTFFNPVNKAAFSGDVLFMGSIGRTDLPGGSFPVLMKSIFEVIIPLGDEVKIYPGHGPETTIGYEKKSNPFLLEHVQG